MTAKQIQAAFEPLSYQIAALPEQEQTRLLAALLDEWQWKISFERSSSKLEAFAESALKEDPDGLDLEDFLKDWQDKLEKPTADGV